MAEPRPNAEGCRKACYAHARTPYSLALAANHLLIIAFWPEPSIGWPGYCRCMCQRRKWGPLTGAHMPIAIGSGHNPCERRRHGLENQFHGDIAIPCPLSVGGGSGPRRGLASLGPPRSRIDDRSHSFRVSDTERCHLTVINARKPVAPSKMPNGGDRHTDRPIDTRSSLPKRCAEQSQIGLSSAATGFLSSRLFVTLSRLPKVLHIGLLTTVMPCGSSGVESHCEEPLLHHESITLHRVGAGGRAAGERDGQSGEH